ncbi:RNA-binding cell elongation regulator Jag/EloR [Helcococcus bovis]|uniref:RNA-binding cell elongation regulator Jag/EloR n=1 Tax=Helcococcus bovis TaxID=3153252 RepID=UPI0038B9A200
MKSIIKSAKTIEEAIDLGIKELGLSKDEVEYEILEEPSKGLFGIFGGNDAIVKIKEKVNNTIDIKGLLSDEEDSFMIDETEYDSNDEDEEDSDFEDRFNNLEEDEEPEVAYIVEKTEEVEIIEQFSNDKTDEHSSLYELNQDSDDEEYGSEDDLYEEGADLEFMQEENKDEEFAIYTSDESTLKNTKDLEFSGQASVITDEDDLQVVAEKVKKNLEDILLKMHIETKVSYETSRDNIINLNLNDISENDTGIVIGSKGETLNAIQYVLSLLTNNSTNKFYRVTLNVGDYRNRRKKSIENNAQRVAFKVLKTKKSIALKPMNSYERRIVHYSLQNYKEIETVSTGKFPNRKVVVKYKG